MSLSHVKSFFQLFPVTSSKRYGDLADSSMVIVQADAVNTAMFRIGNRESTTFANGTRRICII